jgi:protoporphyrinogen/coproporphyrinogen III oxidase
MKKRHIIVLGAGISGLSAAWYLNRAAQPVDITVIEKSDRVGGWLHTEYTSDFLFEKGPRAFRADKSRQAMQLIQDLGLSDQIISSDRKSSDRYLWHKGELRRFPSNPFSFCTSPLTRGFIAALFSEWRRPTKEGDETVWEFALRRFNYDVARLFFDPLVVGIFGGDLREISMRACFPMLKSWEEKYGSVTSGFFHQWKEKKKADKSFSAISGLSPSALFSFKNGVEQLPQALKAKIPAAYHLNQEVQRVAMKDNKVEVTTQDRIYYGDALFCALPIKEMLLLFEPLAPDISKEFLKVPSTSIAIINVGYDQSVLPVRGFGYLVPTYAEEEICGVAFDSSVFPQHNKNLRETRLTVKLEERGREESWYVEKALVGIRKHLGISIAPRALSFKRALRAIPQYGVGHLEKMASLKKEFGKRLPRCFLVGNYLGGVSVDQCIQYAEQTVNEWERNLSL